MLIRLNIILTVYPYKKVTGGVLKVTFIFKDSLTLYTDINNFTQK